MKQEDRAALESLVVDNLELEALETRIARFNLFEATGLVRHEIRHSNFLAFLLDPTQSHGLGETFLKWLLQDTLGSEEARKLHSLSPLRLHLVDLGRSVVRREWRNIDILIENAELRLVVAIENKIGIGEHSNQLARYRETLAREYSGDWQVVLILLSPEATPPTDDKYLPVGYETIYGLLGKALDRLGAGLSADVALVLRHYKELLATHVINDPELDKLCDEIYRKHRHALNLIFERTSRPYEMLARAVQAWISDPANKVVPNQQQKAYISFVPDAWLGFSRVVGKEGGKDRYSVSVLITNGNKGVRLSIELYLGSAEYRNRMKAIAAQNPKVFDNMSKAKSEKFGTLYSMPLIAFEDYASDDPESVAKKVGDRLSAYMRDKLPAQTAAILAEEEATGKPLWPEP